MGVKIINILKDDSFQDILALFRQAPAGEVILVLPRVGKLFKQKDHFAAFASEASQGKKTVSVLTSNPQIAETARTFGFTVMASTPSKPKSKSKKEAHEEIVEAPIVEAAAPIAVDEPDILAELTAATVDGVRGGVPERVISPKAQVEKAAPVPVESSGELDYIDAMWRDRGGKTHVAPVTHRFTPRVPSFLSFSHTAFPKKVAIGILGASIVVLGAVVYLMTGTAHVALTPVGKPLDTQIAVQASDIFATIDDTFVKIPGQLLNVEKTASNTVSSTGSRDVASKARGIITVVNEYSATPQTLIANTRFKSADGKIFRTLQKITVATTKTVEVIADKPGTDYNIPAGKFTIASFEEQGDVEKVAKFYGTTSQPMSGGASGPSAVVTQADYDNAKEAAVSDVKSQITSALEAQGAALTVLNADMPSMGATESTARADDAADSVTVTATGTLKTVGFRQADLFDLIRRVILKKERLTVLPETLTLSYTDVNFKSDLGILTFTVSAKGTGYTPVDTDTIKKDISGKNSAAIRDYFKDREGVQSATITLSPFWVRAVPKNPERTIIDIAYPQAGQEPR